MAVTREKVAAAVEQLVANNQTVSVRAVREALGRGSHDTISVLLRDIRQERGTLYPLEGEVPPHAAWLAKLLKKFGDEVMTQAARAALLYGDAKSQASDDALQEAREQRDEALQNRTKVVAERDSAVARIESLTERITSLEQALEKARDAEKAHFRELAEARANIAQQLRQLESLQERQGEANMATERLSAEVVRLAVERDAALAASLADRSALMAAVNVRSQSDSEQTRLL